MSNTALCYVLFLGFFWILGRAPGRTGLAQFLAYSTGVTWAFYWNRRWTFGSSEKLGPEAIRFFVLQGIMAVGSSALLAFLSAQVPISIHLIWIVVTGLTTVLNYLAAKFIVFRGASPRARP